MDVSIFPLGKCEENTERDSEMMETIGNLITTDIQPVFITESEGFVYSAGVKYLGHSTA